MASFRLRCWKEDIRCVGFGNIADDMLSFSDGDRVEIVGKVQSSRWEKEGVKVFSYQVNISSVLAEGASQSAVESNNRKKVSTTTRKSKTRFKTRYDDFDPTGPGGPF